MNQEPQDFRAPGEGDATIETPSFGPVWQRVVLGFIGAAMLGWAGLNVLLFWRMNAGLWLGDTTGSGGRFGVFSALALPWSFSMRNSPLPELGMAVGVLVLVQFVGMRLVRAAQIYAEAPVRLAIGFTLGFGAVGLAGILLTMAGHLRQVPVVGLWVTLGVLATGLAAWRSSRPVGRWWGRPPEGTPAVELLPERDARAFHERDLSPPPVGFERVFQVVGWLLIGVITTLTFWHAVFLPESYWDSLILYLGYGRMTFLEGAFPFKAEAQVGIGLGANYPHLFSNYGALASATFGQWSDMHQRLVAPLAGLCSVILIHGAMRLAFGSWTVAMVGALLFRLTPHSIAYSTYSSDYAISFLLVAAAFYLVAYFARHRTPGALVAMLAVPAIAMHLNYLMVTLWGPVVLGAMAGLAGRAPAALQPPLGEDDGPYALDRRGMEQLEPTPGPPVSPDAPGPFGLLARPVTWAAFALLLALGSTWYVRNAVLTGNPVYAFFPEIFTKSIRVNPEVLRSAELEWYRNGDGIARLAERHHDARTGQRRDEGDPAFARAATVGDRFAASWQFWFGYETARHADGGGFQDAGSMADRLAELPRLELIRPDGINERPGYVIEPFVHAYKFNPLFTGFLLPGLLVGLWWLVRGILPGRAVAAEARALLVAALVLLIGFLAYKYLLADFYLYQIVAVLVPAAVFGGLIAAPLEGLGRWGRRAGQAVLAVVMLSAALVPGIAMGMMNFKMLGNAVVFGEPYGQLRLDALRSPGMKPAVFYRVVYGDDPDMWEYLSGVVRDEPILTHENRHYVLPTGMKLVHLDDWAVQQMWGLPPEEVVRRLHGMGIRYYLRIPNEARHPVNARLGMDAVIARGLAVEVHRAGGNVLYELPGMDPEARELFGSGDAPKPPDGDEGVFEMEMAPKGS